MRGGKRPTLPLEPQTLRSTAQDTADVLNGTAGDVTAQISALKSAALLRAQSVVDSIEAKITESTAKISQANDTLFTETKTAAEAAKVLTFES